MRWNFSIVVVLGLTATHCDKADSQKMDIVDPENPFPAVMMQIESSGTMELNEVLGVTPDCNVAGQKSLFTQVAEVLVGFSSAGCEVDDRSDASRFDNHYQVIDHFLAMCVDPSGTETLIPCKECVDCNSGDGIFDAYQSLVKFGLTTYDSNPQKDTTQEGMWSYGPDVEVDDSLQNWGVKGMSATTGFPVDVLDAGDVSGGLIPTGDDLGCLAPGRCSTGIQGIAGKNQLVQTALLNTIPAYGSPLAAAMSDLEFYYGNDPFTKKPSASCASWEGCDGDPYYEQRRRYVIYIGDGSETPSDSEYGYEPTETHIEKLYANHGVKTYIVGFIGQEIVGTGQEFDDQRAEREKNIALLNGMATAGQTQQSGEYSFYAVTSQSELNTALTRIMDEISAQ